MSTLTHSGRSVLVTTLLNMVVLSLTACYTAPPIPMDTKVGLIPVQEKIPLKVAIFTNPSHRELYFSMSPSTFPNTQFPAVGPTGGRANGTSETPEEMFPIARELAKSSQEAFTQVFESATVVGDSAAISDGYDAVIVPKVIVYDDVYAYIAKISIAGAFTGENEAQLAESRKEERDWEEIILNWKLVVLDKDQWKVFSDKINKGKYSSIVAYQGQTKPHRMISLGISAGGMNQALAKNSNEKGAVASESLAMLIKEWAALLQKSKEIRDYAAQLKKTP